ncbi:MAG: tetratricopeptide repeat protein [Planctomycetes bacterium]|nr:tetratricopeptide repeat protein [Planctomycetota bacterium]
MSQTQRTHLTRRRTRLSRVYNSLGLIAAVAIFGQSSACSQTNTPTVHKSGVTDSVSSPSADRARMPLDQIGPSPQFPIAKEKPSATIDPDPRAVRQLDRARKRFEEQNWADALTALEKALQIEPSLDEARILFANASMHMGNLAAAREQLAQVLARSPKAIAAHWLLGELAIRDHKEEEAIAEFRLALLASNEGEPTAETALARLSLAQLLQREGYLAAAAEQYEAYSGMIQSPSKAMQSSRELRDAMEQFRDKVPVQLGDIYSTLHEPARALAAYESALNEKPGDGSLQRREFSHWRRPVALRMPWRRRGSGRTKSADPARWSC